MRIIVSLDLFCTVMDIGKEVGGCCGLMLYGSLVSNLSNIVILMTCKLKDTDNKNHCIKGEVHLHFKFQGNCKYARTNNKLCQNINRINFILNKSSLECLIIDH